MSEKSENIKKPITKGVAKVPVVMQLEALECGAACLTMVLAYYDKWIPLEQIREDCGVSRDGSNAKNVLVAARSYGMEAKGYRLEPEVLKEQGQFPCIVHWEFNHFIVVDGFKGGKVYVNDPAKGSFAMTEEAFDKGFTGVALMFEPAEGFFKSGKQKSIMGFVKKRMKGTATSLAFIVITTVISSLLGIIQPGFSRVFLDELLPGNEPGWVAPFLIFLAILSLVEAVIAWIERIVSLRISGKFDVVGSTSYMWKVLHLPMRFFSQRMAGDIQQRKDTNASIAETLVDTFAPLTINTGMMFFYFVVMLRYNVGLTITGLISIVINFFVARMVSKKRINTTRVLMRDQGKLYSTTIAGIEMMETIKSSGAENGFFGKWSGYQASVNNGQIEYMKINTYFGLIPSIVSSVLGSIIVLEGAYLTIKGNFTIGLLTAFQGFLSSFTAPAMELISASQTITEMRTSMERIEDVMEYPDDPQITEKEEVAEKEEGYEKLKGEVELKNVTFGYSPLGEPVIKDFSMKVKPGSKVAFVGASGCGKSTLSKLISGLYAPWKGEILFDGKPISQINRNVFTGSLAVVDQDIIMFEDTVLDNVRMWDKSIEEFEVILAARDAEIHDDIVQKPGGYQHKMIEGAKDFSGGQKQRMEIARVLAQDPTIIIMDEATSALDAKTEYEVVNSIKNRGITCIVIAHRLSTIRDCDEIVVLENGEVVERGTHEELYKLGGAYTRLVSNE